MKNPAECSDPLFLKDRQWEQPETWEDLGDPVLSSEESLTSELVRSSKEELAASGKGCKRALWALLLNRCC